MDYFEQHPERKIVLDLPELIRRVQALRDMGCKIVATIGSWDLKHIGQERYLRKAREHGDILVVGVDSDRAIHSYKGPNRPIATQEERCESLSYLSFVDVVTLVDDVDKSGRWNYELLRAIKPDVYIAVEDDSYTEEQLSEIRGYVGELILLPRQAADTSTSSFIERIKRSHMLDEASEAGGGAE